MAAVERAAFSDPWPASAFADLIGAAHARVVVALDASAGHASDDASDDADGDALLGYCVLLHAADEGEIANIATAASARRRGIGGLLLDDALRAAEHIGARAVYLEVRTSNEAARALYASRGFVAVGRRRGYYRQPLEDALVLRRELPASP
jgi:ribosomal-protein-alanine N-acetyltransferase